jgi:hypothetical protein
MKKKKEGKYLGLLFTLATAISFHVTGGRCPFASSLDGIAMILDTTRTWYTT